MTRENQNRDGNPSKGDPLNLELDAALAKYAAVEARPGLEQRILAHLRAEAERTPTHPWRLWSIAAACAAIVLVALTLAWRSSPHHAPTIAEHSRTTGPVTAQAIEQPKPRLAIDHTRRSKNHRVAARTNPQSAQAAVVANAYPKLDQFPSRQPMSEQEAALIHYVREFPGEAALIAQAQDAYEKELERRKEAEHAENELSSSDLQER